jgi:hypothetical protein
MELKETYLDRVLGEVEDLASRVAILKGCFATQKVNVKLEHYWELEYVRTRFAEFKRRVMDLEEAEDSELPTIEEGVEVAWKDLIHAVETLTTALD